MKTLRIHRLWSGLLVAAVVTASSALLGAAEEAPEHRTESVAATPEAVFAAAADAIERGAYTEAIDRLELLADQGFVHPDASFNRGVAYLGRARGQSALPGDRGRAVASLKETLLLRPEDASARTLLDRAQQELGRERARRGSTPPVETPSPSRAVVGLLHENTWTALAALFSLLTTLGLGLRLGDHLRRDRASGSLALTGSILASVGGLGLLLTGGATALSQSLRRSTQPAVVIADSTRLLDARGRPLEGPALPEGAEVYVTATEGPLVRIERSANEAWLHRSDIRVLAAPSTASDGSPSP